jgi:hypothetical protein
MAPSEVLSNAMDRRQPRSAPSPLLILSEPLDLRLLLPPRLPRRRMASAGPLRRGLAYFLQLQTAFTTITTGATARCRSMQYHWDCEDDPILRAEGTSESGASWYHGGGVRAGDQRSRPRGGTGGRTASLPGVCPGASAVPSGDHFGGPRNLLNAFFDSNFTRKQRRSR